MMQGRCDIISKLDFNNNLSITASFHEEKNLDQSQFLIWDIYLNLVIQRLLSRLCCNELFLKDDLLEFTIWQSLKFGCLLVSNYEKLVSQALKAGLRKITKFYTSHCYQNIVTLRHKQYITNICQIQMLCHKYSFVKKSAFASPCKATAQLTKANYCGQLYRSMMHKPQTQKQRHSRAN